MIMFRGCKIAFYKLNFQRAHFTNYHHMSESILNLVNLFLGKGRSCRPEMFCQKSVFENFAKCTKNTYVGVSVFEVCNFIVQETLAQVFAFKFCENFKNTFFCRRPPVAASVKTYQLKNISK